LFLFYSLKHFDVAIDRWDMAHRISNRDGVVRALKVTEFSTALTVRNLSNFASFLSSTTAAAAAAAAASTTMSHVH
jgi:hypothetical protein